jgi:DNA-binding transcriptional ArsR family regulator
MKLDASTSVEACSFSNRITRPLEIEMLTTSNIAEIGFLLGDPARINMVLALLDGRSRTARELAEAAGVTPQTASSHISKLTAAGLVKTDRQGRHHYHRLASPEVGRLLEQMHVAAASVAPTHLMRAGPADRAMRELRSCYDHLAGRVAVQLASQALLDEGDGPAENPQISPAGAVKLSSIGLDLDALRGGRRPFCRACLDWSERRPHLAGALGAALLDQLENLDWIRRRSDTRVFMLTPAGQRGLRETFGIEASLEANASESERAV